MQEIHAVREAVQQHLLEPQLQSIALGEERGKPPTTMYLPSQAYSQPPLLWHPSGHPPYPPSGKGRMAGIQPACGQSYPQSWQQGQSFLIPQPSLAVPSPSNRSLSGELPKSLYEMPRGISSHTTYNKDAYLPQMSHMCLPQSPRQGSSWAARSDASTPHTPVPSKLPWPLHAGLAGRSSSNLSERKGSAARRCGTASSGAKTLSRVEAKALASDLSSAANGNGDKAPANTEKAMEAAFDELVRQTKVACLERGEMLDSVRNWYQAQLRVLKKDHLEQSRELIRMRALERLLFEGTEGYVARRGDGAEHDEETKQRRRLEQLARAARTLPAEHKVQLISDLSSGTPVERADLMRALIGAASVAEKVDFLSRQVESLPSADVLKVWAAVSADASTSDRQQFLRTVASLLSPQQRATQAVELISGNDPETRAALAQQLVQGLHVADRLPAAAGVVQVLARQERQDLLQSCLNSLPIDEMAQLLNTRVDELESKDRVALLSEVLSNLNVTDRSKVSGQLLLELPTETRLPILLSLTGQMLRSERDQLTRQLNGERDHLSPARTKPA